MKKHFKTTIYILLVMLVFSCKNNTKKEININSVEEIKSLSAKDILIEIRKKHLL